MRTVLLVASAFVGAGAADECARKYASASDDWKT